jgi:hypothetical protein
MRPRGSGLINEQNTHRSQDQRMICVISEKNRDVDSGCEWKEETNRVAGEVF